MSQQSQYTAGPIDRDEVRRAAMLLIPQDADIEIRGLKPTRSVIVSAGKPDEIIAAVERIAGQSRACYWTINPVKNGSTTGKGGTAQDVDILRRRRLLIDIDPIKQGGGKDCCATDKEKAAARLDAEAIRDHLADQGWPEPITLGSGNGWYLTYAIDLPNNDASDDLVHGVLHALADREFPGAKIDTSVSNASRIARVPGTWNRKGDDTPERPHRMARLVSVPDQFQIVTREQLAKVAGEVEPVARTPKMKPGQTRHFKGVPQSRATAYVNKVLTARCQEVRQCPPGDQPGSPGRNNVLNDAAFALGRLAHYGAIEEAEVFAALVDAAEESGLDDAEIMPTIQSGWRAGQKFPRDLKDSKEWKAKQRAGEAKTQTPGQQHADDVMPISTRLDTVLMRPTRWLVPSIIPRGGITLLAGDGGEGKSTLTRGLAADLSRGRCAFGRKDTAQPPMSVLLIGCEDSVSSTIVPGLAAAGADLARVHTLDGYQIAGQSHPLTLADTSVIRTLIKQFPGIACVVIDPVSAFIPAGTNDHVDAEVRGLIRPLADLAEELDIAILMVRHLNKGDGANAGNLVSGSRGWVNASRASYLIGPEPDGEPGSRRRIIAAVKNNLAMATESLAFETRCVTDDERDRVLSLPGCAGLNKEDRDALAAQLFVVQWLGVVDTTAADLARARRGEKQRGAVGENATAWLKEFLGKGDQPSAAVFAEADAAGITKATLLRAKASVNARAYQRGGQWFWSLTPAKDVFGRSPRKDEVEL